MRSYVRTAAILSTAVAAAVWSASALRADDAPSTPGEHARQAVDNAQDAATSGIKATVDPSRNATNEAVDAKTASDIQSRLASIVNNAVTPNGFDELLGSFDQPTRDRIGLERYKDFDKLNASIDQFRKDFHDKYNQDFQLKSDLFVGIPVYRGPDKDHARVVMPASTPTSRLERQANGALSDGASIAPTDQRAPATPGLSAKDFGHEDWAKGNLDLNMIIEGVVGNGWRLQVPATLTARDLSGALTTELTTLCGMKDQWPSDVNMAYLKVAKHIYKTIENTAPAAVTVENR